MLVMQWTTQGYPMAAQVQVECPLGFTSSRGTRWGRRRIGVSDGCSKAAKCSEKVRCSSKKDSRVRPNVCRRHIGWEVNEEYNYKY